jgi:uncharacterized protein (DUF1697 family)
MPTYVALVRAVNVAGRKLAMAELKGMFESLGFTDVRTLLQSGNVVFGGAMATSAEMESFLESETEKRLKLRTDYLVRTADEWSAIIERNPMRREGRDDPSHLLVLPSKSTPATADVAALQKTFQGRETLLTVGHELYAYYPAGIGTSKLTVALIERKLKTRCTGRNWNTVLKIQAVATSRESAHHFVLITVGSKSG